MSVTVVEKAAHHRLTTVEAVKSEAEITDCAADVFLGDLIDQASAVIVNHCGRPFAIETVREAIELPCPSPSILPARWPFTELVSLKNNGQTIAVDGTETDDAGLVYRLDGAGDRIDWPRGYLLITYRAGYVVPGQPARTLPHDVERACLSLVKGAWFARGRDPLIRSEDVDGVLATAYQVGGFSGSSLPPDVEGLLSNHRSYQIG